MSGAYNAVQWSAAYDIGWVPPQIDLPPLISIFQLVDETLLLLYGLPTAEHPSEDTIVADADLAASQIELATPSMWRRGDYAEFLDAEIVILAEDPDPQTGVVSVRRAQRGTTITSHTTGEVVRRNSPHPMIDCAVAVADTILHDLWPHVWSPVTMEYTWQANRTLYPLPPNVTDVDEVYQSPDLLTHEPIPFGKWDVRQTLDKSLSPFRGAGLLLQKPPYPTSPIYVKGRLKAAIGGHADSSMRQIIPYGAAARMLAGRAAALKIDPARNVRASSDDVLRNYQAMTIAFEQRRDQLRRKLMDEQPTVPKFRPRKQRIWR